MNTSSLSLGSSEGIRRFQAGELPEADQQWHRLVPFEAREALGKKEVERQSVIFEVFTSEKGYVSDLESIKEVFTKPIAGRIIPTHLIFESCTQGFHRTAQKRITTRYIGRPSPRIHF